MNRKLPVIILALVLVLCFTATAMAAEPLQDTQAAGPLNSGAPSAASPTPEPIPSDVVRTDPNYFDAGKMNAPYSQGYSPILRNSQAIIILPLIVDVSKLDGVSGLNTTINLGAGDPFVANNYDRDIPYGQFAGGSCVIEYDIPLTWPRTNGTHPVTITVNYTLKDGTVSSQSFSVNVIITDGPVATPEPSPTPEPVEGPVSQPKVIMSNYTVTPDPVYAGETFTVLGTVINTSKTMSVKNVTVNYTGETTDLMPEEGANTSYIDSIPAADSAQFSFAMEARADAKAGPQKVLVVIEYEDAKANKYTVNDTIMVQVRQHIRLVNDPPKFPLSLYIGDTTQASLNLYNKGKNTLYNVTVDIDMEGIYPEASAFLGNFESGASKTADMYASVGISPETGEMTEPGHYKGYFVVTYEDEYGDVYEDKIEIETDIMEMMSMEDPGMMEDPSMMEGEETGAPGLPWWAYVAIAVVAAVIVIAVVVNVRKKKRERELLEEMDKDDLY